MLVYSTVFPVANSISLASFQEICRSWLILSPHYSWRDSDIGVDIPSEMETIDLDTTRLERGNLSFEDTKIGAMRHCNKDTQAEWITECVLSFRGTLPWLSIRLMCNNLRPGSPLPQSKKPYIAKMFIEKFKGASDGCLKVIDEPIALLDDDASLELMKKIISGDSENVLPAVYISCSHSSETYVDAASLARELSASCHVILEPSRDFSFRLRDATGGRNSYGGAVGIYWPAGGGVHERLLPMAFRPRELGAAVGDRIRRGLCEMRPISGTNWTAVTELIARKSVASVKRNSEANIDEFVRAFDEELAVAAQKLNEAEEEILRLGAENRRLVNLTSSGGGVLTAGNEVNLIKNEIREIVVDALSKEQKRVHPEGRAAVVLSDLLEANPASNHRIDLKDRINQILSRCSRIDKKVLSSLERLGFRISEDGKHYKLVFGDDERCVFMLPKTPSDHRSTKNAVSQITSRLCG
jgi:hypothetical protein